MSIPNTSASFSSLIAFTQDVDYTRTEGFKHFKASYNHKNTRTTRNDPRGSCPHAEDVYQAAKGPGCSQWSFNSLSLQDFIKMGAVTAHHRVKRLSLAPYYTAQM